MFLRRKRNFHCWLSMKKVRLLSHAHKESSTETVPLIDANLESSYGQNESDIRVTTSPVPLIDAYLEVGMVNRAAPIFDHNRRNGYKFEVSTYNRILNGWLEQGSGLIAEMFWKSMLRDGVSPNLKTYGIWLSYHSRREDWSAVDKALAELSDKGYDLSCVLREGKLSKNEAAQVLKIMFRYGIPLSPPKELKENYPTFLKKSLSNGSSKHSFKSCIPKEMCNTSDAGNSVLMECLSRQMEHERNVRVEVSSVTTIRTKKRQTQGDVFDMISKWRQELSTIISRDIEECLATCELFQNQVVNLETQFPLLAALPAKTWADICIDEVVFGIMSQPNGFTTSYISSLIGLSAHKQMKLRRMVKCDSIGKIFKVYKEYLAILSENPSQQIQSRLIWRELDEKYLADGSMVVDSILPYHKRIFHQAAASVVSRFLEVTIIPENMCGKKKEHGFEHVLVHKRLKRLEGHVRPTVSLLRLLKKLNTLQNNFFAINSSSMPMLVPPVPWTSPTFGGFALANNCIMRTTSYKAPTFLEEHNLDTVYDAINCVASVPWKVNTKILDVIIDIFNNGGNQEIRIPSNPYDDELVFQRLSFYEKKKSSEQFSLWMDMLYRLSLSHHFRNEIFWLPHDLDFRGRCYPCSTHLSHTTMDAGRALLQFANGEPLGQRGVLWLKLHLMNMYGLMKKEPMEERLKYFETMTEVVVDSAKNPLTGKRWWMKGTNPFQVLASCIEYTNAIESDDPNTYISYLPVHQDGSCNGLQHYSALGRDSAGGKMVNLIHSAKPSDTYMEVANLVEEKRKLDAKAGDEIAELLEGCISRKVVKQTVMTTVYGVTTIGARLQVQRQLPSHLNRNILFNCALYITRLIFDVLSSRFQETRTIQNWLTGCAVVISRTGHKVQWITPLGLPVLQPYDKNRNKQKVTTVLQDFTHTDSNVSLPNVAKQKAAFPPNFVHSIDSSHMMMTALGCLKSGFQFVAVHDSFWTNAGFVDDLNKICREQFVNLHKEPILDNLAEYFEEQYGNLRYWDKKQNIYRRCQFPTLPAQGTLDLSRVLTSTYFFS